MNLETLRKYCLSLSYVTENVQWEHLLVFRIETSSSGKSAKMSSRIRKRRVKTSSRPQGKIFCIANTEPEGARVTFKSTPEIFAELVELPSIIPAPYLARNHWISVETWDALPPHALLSYIKESYDLVWDKLPKSVQKRLESGA